MGTAFAAEFTDSGSIGPPYREAVAEMSRRGVLNGFPDGSFQPAETLTREQGAKIVTYMVLGDGVNSLTCTEAPFNDVAADRWSAPCIAWCVERQILLGYGDGRYGPDDTLTGDQFAKMLLCALDLARDGNYRGLGAGWYAATREDARTVGLYTGDLTMETNLPITRQQAALLAWNAVKAAQAVEPQPTVPSSPGGTTPPDTSSPPAVGGDIEAPEIDIGGGETPTPENPGGETSKPPSTGDIELPEVP